MRSMSLAVAVVAAIAATLVGSGPGRGQETVTIVARGSGPACNCKSAQTPPWHGSVGGVDCGPTCPPGNVYHANPCGQLLMKCQVHHGHHGYVTLPPCFPRLHAWWSEGSMPTPRPLHLPRCHQCGAVIEGGF
jgi:hypothetical protein